MNKTPQAGDVIYTVRICGGHVEVSRHVVSERFVYGRVNGVKTTHNVNMSEHEWLMDGCRHDVKSLYPCKPLGLPDACPLEMSATSSPFLYCQERDLEVAKLSLLRAFGSAALNVAGKAEKIRDSLYMQVRNMS